MVQIIIRYILIASRPPVATQGFRDPGFLTSELTLVSLHKDGREDEHEDEHASETEQKT